ncbi:UTRA domain-containing protein [Roseospira visakhapatnamensis]|uniref:GntR family histidine utilization transcriptional repressor n=1 Tax=Roseospira visakhapatnamensis TaxID=390880 RepID=A0A7W6RBL5_9PROT|nr:UTRA domain-containing protein [Roseospira visakhapatnamensis]MBB4265362.1 GntR family histidine utilization transcriptional repressor [Roseospira visakhapatnamensis]
MARRLPQGAAYQAVQREILARIRDKTWPPGALIPGEIDLAAEFGCARATISRAMRELAEAGVLERKRRAGTRVAANPVRRAMLDIPMVRQQVTDTGRAYGHDLLFRAVEPPPEAIRARLGLRPGTAALHARSLHRADGRPFQVEDRWINLDAVPEAVSVDLAAISANEWLVREVPLSTAETMLSAAAATEVEAALLGCPPGAPLLEIERTTWLGDLPITTVRLLHPPGFRVVGRV